MSARDRAALMLAIVIAMVIVSGVMLTATYFMGLWR